ncbi:TIGR03943 family putative permease subunit [Nocardia cerradoensis]|uniref:TIGR03943 family putative permease subunit n=1 Tax=Nocardia cerradoensis TaxID=85688 RepID=UPI0002E41364|nr:TIGR03943 family protein [Nocardia cerradoensis]NKY41910.1 TIGR03943 family protein [Nocardia cerradoensis]
MKRETQNLLLVLVGVAILRTAIDGSYLRYVKPGLHPFLLISGTGFVVFAAISIVRDIRRSGISRDDGHGRAQWLLLAPAAALLLITPPALGADSVATSSRVQVAAPVADEPELRPFPPLPDEPAPALTIYDLANRALYDSTHSLDGREITVSGFVLAPEGESSTRQDVSTIDLARVLITCCVADARYISVHLSGIGEPIAADTWLQVQGTVEPGSAGRDPDKIPTLRVTDVQRIPAPDHGYEHPY